MNINNVIESGYDDMAKIQNIVVASSRITKSSSIVMRISKSTITKCSFFKKNI